MANTKGSDNPFPSILVVEATEPTAPSAGQQRLYIDSTTHKLKRTNSSGTDVDIESSGSGLTDPMTTRGDIIVRNASNVTARLGKGSAATVLTSDGTDVAWAAPAGGGGVTPGQVKSYPTTFSGDTINGSSTTPFVDVAAFSNKTVLNSRILQLQALGASKDQRVRVTLGTTKAGAFDVTTCVAYDAGLYSSKFDSYLEVRGSTSADAQLFIARIGVGSFATGGGFDNIAQQFVRVGGSTISSADANSSILHMPGDPHTFRFVRDGSNVITFYMAHGTLPMAFHKVFVWANSTPFAATVSGTLARIEYAIHTPSGPGGTVEFNGYVDYLASV